MGSSFLLKALTVAGAGGGPIIFFGLTSTSTEEQRQFRWFINLDQQDKGSTSEAERKGGYWLEGLTKDKWQGVSEEEWTKFAGTAGRSVYKLAFRSAWSQEANKNVGEKSAQGALGLIKASWGGGNNKELKVEEINVGNERRVWLIIAKSETSIYLIPVVRSSTPIADFTTRAGKWGESAATKKNWREGVEDIGAWTTEFDKSDKWEEKRNENLQKVYGSGIWMKRVGSYVKEEGGKIMELKQEDWKKVCYENGSRQGERENKCNGAERGTRVYQNAARIQGRKLLTPRCKECKWNEEYFSLDIAVLGDTTKLKETSKAPKSLVQEITIEDKITQVVGVRLDQVVINETGIGDGKDNQVSWGNVSKPSLIRELLK